MIVKKLTDRDWPEGQVTDCYVGRGKVWPDLVYEERQRLSSEPDDSVPDGPVPSGL
jgi:hypothetical protein